MRASFIGWGSPCFSNLFSFTDRQETPTLKPNHLTSSLTPSQVLVKDPFSFWGWTLIHQLRAWLRSGCDLFQTLHPGTSALPQPSDAILWKETAARSRPIVLGLLSHHLYPWRKFMILIPKSVLGFPYNDISFGLYHVENLTSKHLTLGGGN